MTPKNLICGTTIYIDRINIELEYGIFTSYTFQNLITKGYIVALASGDIFNKKNLYSRIHSSCITSETFCSLDCDCKSQLCGALKEIKKKDGILFYLQQEGRGCGYIGKSRACQMVQYSKDTITTFEAYKTLGMEKDYRNYSSISDIFHILDISPSIILLTNNPDKIKGLQDIGIKIKETKSIEIKPNPFNLQYLISKKDTGHKLNKIDNINTSYFIPLPLIKPFPPYNLEKCKRFVHTSSYYLPIGNIGDFCFIDKNHPKNDKYREIDFNIINGHKVVKRIGQDSLSKYYRPYWFKANIIYDIINQNEFVVLTFRDNNVDCENTIPIVRVHSESIFNRFPLEKAIYKEIYYKSIQHIIMRGYGFLIIFYQDGHGFGLGNYILNQTTEKENLNDIRDFQAVSLIMKHYLKLEKIDLVYSCKKSLLKIKKHIDEIAIEINKIIFIGIGDEQLGHHSLIDRNNYIYQNLLTKYQFDIQLTDIDNDIILTGMGSSTSHAKYLSYLLNKYLNLNTRFVSYGDLINNCSKVKSVIIFSQGTSPHIKKLIELLGNKKIFLITSSLEKLADNIIKIKLTDDVEKQTLLRIKGPFQGFKLSWELVSHLLFDKLSNNLIISEYNNYLSFFNNLVINSRLPNYNFFRNLIDKKSLCLVSSFPILSFLENIRMKFIEGCFFDKVLLIEEREFVHGTYQLLENKRDNKDIYNIIWFNNEVNLELKDKLTKLMKPYPTWIINSKLMIDLKIIDYELIINQFIIQIIDYLDINQVEWKGKNSQYLVYNN